MNRIRYCSEAALLVLLGILIKMGRVTWLGLFIPLFLMTLLELNEMFFHKKELRKAIELLLAAYALWLFNDLMAIGKFSVAGGKAALLNYLLYLMIFMFFYGIFGKRKAALIVPEVLLLVIGLANAIVKAIRRTPISAGDIFSIKTAMAVAGNYSMEFDKDFILKVGLGIVTVGLINAIFLTIAAKSDKTYSNAIGKRSILTGIPILFGMMLFLTSWIVTFSGRAPDYFTHETNGFALNLYLQWKDIKIKEPDGYLAESVQALSEQYPSDTAFMDKALPNIIVIMNESFADLRVLGAYETNIEVLPILDGLKENVVKGNLYASVYGGNTANSEYEFLTGSSIAYFSERVVPFQLYMNEERPSLISQMKQIGYQTVFMHPYRAYSWNRPSVYTALQADEMIFEEDMPELKRIRSYASDESQYAYVRKYLEQEDRMQPLFLFDVTVQNHGGYTGVIDDLQDKVTILDHESEYVETENYLTLAHESDRAIGELLEYLKGFDEPTAVLFFGDHQPAIETGFVEMAMGKKESEFTLEDRQKMYTVPFFLWCNYDIEDRQVEKISINYLSTLLCSELNLPQTGFQKFLGELYWEMPVINSVAISDAEGNFSTKENYLQEQKGMFGQYNEIIYNYMFDSPNRVNALYELRVE